MVWADAVGKPLTASDTDAAASARSAKQFLVIPRWEPPVVAELDKWDRNLAGKSLLPDMDPFDWPDASEIEAAQRALPQEVRNRLHQVESCQPGVTLLRNADNQIVLPQGATELIARICAVAHQGRHGHLPHKVSAGMIRK